MLQVLRAAVAARVPYMDVCDDVDYSQEIRGLSADAAAAGIPAVTTCVIYPGLSNVMATALVRQMRARGVSPKSLKFSYYTAGTGGVGGTILASTFLLMAEDCRVYRVRARPIPASAKRRRAFRCAARASLCTPRDRARGRAGRRSGCPRSQSRGRLSSEIASGAAAHSS